jgi:hypothetical protein
MNLTQQETSKLDGYSKLDLKIEEGFIICEKCKGEGSLFFSASERMRVICDKCYGIGKLSWLENVFGKESPIYPGYSGSLSGFSNYQGISGFSTYNNTCNNGKIEIIVQHQYKTHKRKSLIKKIFNFFRKEE